MSKSKSVAPIEETDTQIKAEDYDEYTYGEGSHCRHVVPLTTTPEPETYVISKDSPKAGPSNTPKSELRKAKLALLRSNGINKSYSILANRNVELIELLCEELARSEKCVKDLIQHLRYAQEKWIMYHKLYVKEQAINNHPGCPDYSYLADKEE